MPALPAPSAGEVHLWKGPLDLESPMLRTLTGSLSPAERAHALRFRFPRDRTRFSAGRGWLRRLLSGYLDIDPAGVVLGKNTFGKPLLAPPSQHWLRFSVSHSEGMAVFAVARGREVGVDVERVLDDLPVEAVARFFSVLDQEVLAALPPVDRGVAAFALWTRKEAYLKAMGVGFATEHGGRGHPGHRRGDWTIIEFDAGTGFAAAVAVEGLGVEVPDAVRSLSVDLNVGESAPA
jgi:4'-phosphopantetheinyl transferase